MEKVRLRNTLRKVRAIKFDRASRDAAMAPQEMLDFLAHITGKKHWTYVPSRWVMYSGDIALHGATCESGTSFLTENEAGQEPVRLRRSNFSGPSWVECASDQRRVARSER